ncbi:MAG: hypothetical protein FJ184_12015 [Gammaproteobacteria bacterium]|nr:hypothetical protein [Gammaproteobacteria bacterium]
MNGFSKSSLILPFSKSSIIFKTYEQFLNNDTILEGAELGCRDAKWLNIGARCDEYLVGPELLATLRFRLATRNSKLIVTFTPVDGYTEVVRDYVQGAETLKSKKASEGDVLLMCGKLNGRPYRAWLCDDHYAMMCDDGLVARPQAVAVISPILEVVRARSNYWHAIKTVTLDAAGIATLKDLRDKMWIAEIDAA